MAPASPLGYTGGAGQGLAKLGKDGEDVMKAILILIITAGSVQGISLGPDQTLQVREIEFSSMEACHAAANQMTSAGRRSNEWQRIFSREEVTQRVLVPSPVIIAECVAR